MNGDRIITETIADHEFTQFVIFTWTVLKRDIRQSSRPLQQTHTTYENGFVTEDTMIVLHQFDVVLLWSFGLKAETVLQRVF